MGERERERKVNRPFEGKELKAKSLTDYGFGSHRRFQILKISLPETMLIKDKCFSKHLSTLPVYLCVASNFLLRQSIEENFLTPRVPLSTVNRRIHYRSFSWSAGRGEDALEGKSWPRIPGPLNFLLSRCNSLLGGTEMFTVI